MATARGKAEQADIAAKHAQEDSEYARICSKQFAPEFQQPGVNLQRHRLDHPGQSDYSKYGNSTLYRGADSDYTSGLSPDLNLSTYGRQGSHRANPGLVSGQYEEANFNGGYDNYIHEANYSNLPSHTSFRGIQDDSRYSISQVIGDHFDQYKLEPTRDLSSFSAKSQFTTEVRPNFPKKICATDWTPDSGVSEGMDNDDSPSRSNRRSTLPNLLPSDLSGQDSVASLAPSDFSNSSSANEDVLRKRGGGGGATAIVNTARAIGGTSGNALTPNRTASVYNNATPRGGGGGGGGGGARGGATAAARAPDHPPRRKKSLPDSQQLPKQVKVMSREEVSTLSSHRREEVRRQLEEADRFRANPLLYIFNPAIKEWLSRQQLMMLVLFINISLAIMFFKLLT
uniref:Uncharacterized protein n=1 Tax=Strigamia maritima TaxID=126957 RepID=T1JBY7_STRMM